METRDNRYNWYFANVITKGDMSKFKILFETAMMNLMKLS